jgi:hypothetical protein
MQPRYRKTAMDQIVDVTQSASLRRPRPFSTSKTTRGYIPRVAMTLRETIVRRRQTDNQEQRHSMKPIQWSAMSAEGIQPNKTTAMHCRNRYAYN